MKEGLFNEMEDELILNDYPHIQFIHFQIRSFGTISSLTISNLPELKLLTFEGYSFHDTTSVTLSSIYFTRFSQIQMFLSLMESILMLRKYSSDYIQIIFNMMRVSHFILLFIRIY